MKKVLSTLSLFGCIMLSLTARAQQVKTYIGISAGVMNPYSEFKQADYGTTTSPNNKAGFAKKGPVFAIDGAYYFYKNLAIAGLVSFQDQGQLNSDDETNLSNGYRENFGSYQSTVTASNRYHNINALLGPQYTFTYKGFNLDLRAMAGVVKSLSTPEIKVYLTNYNGQQIESFTQSSSKSTAFAYAGSVGLRYNFGKVIGIALRENYVATPTGVAITTSERNTNTGRLVTNQRISEFQTTLGLIINLKTTEK
ncbi:outer membrane beta-barrel protein [Mucilaginibacter robiniae]|uniref:Outer membrane beta-barrel protein n=1 Tax=Mucilaginibacter robiniae TaxID=2728022 RepID=A0A7L5E2P4_9SPHI|nr:outer membrane beta-barrel protein [Mucilaginibacter robiniae]QJD94616.1 outer membrane beta-barrel protein [Mucilaginibacter robiniae]